MKQTSTDKTGMQILACIHKIKPFLAGSLTLTKKRCGNPKCRCFKEGPIHETALLTWKENKKTHTLYVPIHMRKEVTQWIEEWKKLKILIQQMSKTKREFLRNRKKNNE